MNFCCENYSREENIQGRKLGNTVLNPLVLQLFTNRELFLDLYYLSKGTVLYQIQNSAFRFTQVNARQGKEKYISF